MRIELKGLLAALIAALIVLGAVFGIAAIVNSGQAGSPAASRSATPAAGTKPPVLNAAFVAEGHAFFTQSCAACHGATGGGGFGPNLHNEDLSDAQIALTIKNGVKGKMPAFGGKYHDQQAQALAAYIRSLK